MTATYPTIRQGSTGPTVTFLQKNLITLGYGSILSPNGADGIFGSKTNQAVRDFQLKNSLVVDGIVGSKTWEKILTQVPSTDILVNTIQATVQPVPSATAPKPPEPSLPSPTLPTSVQVEDTRVTPKKSDGVLMGAAILVGFWFMIKPNKKRR
ncbi:peptidoglycan-binding domain-containing protein [Leptospira levettii]|uniref:peptidoglycan-binding domain-containing protein n=1 Tax=Leptospira levettii TaxID=2023178 RepID=UPI0010832286|nr:peptidoglycan-binding domain-containing protein [Leptospira levettii]TGM28246.1 peptidoglycan-binding protein [Leptospira levettii]